MSIAVWNYIAARSPRDQPVLEPPVTVPTLTRVTNDEPATPTVVFSRTPSVVSLNPAPAYSSETAADPGGPIFGDPVPLPGPPPPAGELELPQLPTPPRRNRRRPPRTTSILGDDDGSSSQSSSHASTNPMPSGSANQPLFMGPWALSREKDKWTFHTSTVGLDDGRPALLIDTGAVGNLQGESFAIDTAARASQHGLTTEVTQLQEAVHVNGVGSGSQKATHQHRLPAALVDKRTNRVTEATFTAPCIPDSKLPPLWGLRSLKENRVWLDLVNNVMYMLGPGDMEVTPPPGTRVLQLEQGRSGHLFLPINQYHRIQGKNPEVVLCDAWAVMPGTATTHS